MIEIIIGILAIVLLLSVLSALNACTKPVDNREPYLRDSAGHVWALCVGPGVNHEQFIHDGTPHQNPAVREEGRWFLFFYYTVEVSYYPITINAPQGHPVLPDIEGIQARVDEARRRGKDVELVALDAGLEREVIKRENGEQLQRDVDAGKLAYKLNGKKR